MTSPKRKDYKATREYVDALKKFFLRSKIGWDDGEKDWVGASFLGEGGQGHAGLWVKVDPKTQKVVDRVVVKENVLPPAIYSQSNYWKPGATHRIPFEGWVNYIMQHQPENIVECKGWSARHEKYTFRLYLEYCALGDLWHTVIKPYWKRDIRVPEPFCWAMLENLARAAVSLENPVLCDVDGSFVVHMDIKPDNIFLKPPHPEKFPKYPVAKLGDFGAAIISYPGEITSKFARAVHTPGYLPPEVWFRISGRDLKFDNYYKYQGYLRSYPFLKEQITGAANIWAIGRVVAWLMDLRNEPYDNYEKEEDMQNWYPNLDKTGYSPELIDLVHYCMSPAADDRPTPGRLLASVLRLKELYVDVMDDKRCLDKEYNGQFDLIPEVNLQDSRYPLGHTVPASDPAGKGYHTGEEGVFSFFPGEDADLPVGKPPTGGLPEVPAPPSVTDRAVPGKYAAYRPPAPARPGAIRSSKVLPARHEPYKPYRPAGPPVPSTKPAGPPPRPPPPPPPPPLFKPAAAPTFGPEFSAGAIAFLEDSDDDES